MKLAGRNAIITGASEGFGFQIAKYFLLEGASVVICARNAEKLEQARQALLPCVHAGAQLCVTQADISKPDQVNRLVEIAMETLHHIDILVANAGIYGPKGSIDEVDWDEWSEAIDINLKGTALQCRAILPHMKARREGKIIILSGGGATKPMPNLSAYAASKAAVVRFAETLAQEVESYYIDVNTIAPGALNTRLLDEILEAGPEKVGEAFYLQSVKQKESGGTSFDVGSRLCVFLGTTESNGITGRLISAVWDPWEHLASRVEDFRCSDIYTLRRIVPEDRGKTWTTSS